MTLQGLSSRVILMILDGFGDNPKDLKNAIKHAHKPYLDSLFSHYPYTTLEPGGEAVGLPKGVSGNSEVGHLNLGAGKPVRQDLVRINEAIENKTFESMDKFQELIQKTLTGNKRLHLMGLLSDGGVHSHLDHLKEILRLLKKYPEIKIYLHAFMDGRDTPKDKGIKYLEDILSVGGFTLASLQGRSIGMDRDRRYEKIEACVNMFTGKNGVVTSDPVTYIKEEYQKGLFDEFITPALFVDSGKMQSGDQVFFFNFRPDRAKQISLALNDPHFSAFKVDLRLNYFLCLTPYVDEELPNLPIMFDKEKIKGTLSEYLSTLGIKQFKIAETEKYAHVTYFFNGGEEKPFPGEERQLIPSPKEVATYDLKPQMSAYEVAKKLCEKLDDKDLRFFVVNFANADMVGHTGNYEAAVKAIEALNEAVKMVIEKAMKLNVAVILTADHGNADQMIYPEGGVHTSHTEAKVPCCLVHPSLRDQEVKKISNGSLKDIASTVTYLMNVPKSSHFTGETIFS